MIGKNIIMTGFFGRIIQDFKQKQLLPLKLLFFVHASTLFVLYPYLTIHMRELGISVEETAIMSAVTPVIAIVMPPLAGMVADKIGNFKLLLALFSSLGGGASLLLLLVPIGRITVTYPERVILDMGCGGLQNGDLGYLELGLAEDFPCDRILTNSSNNGMFRLDTRLESCGFICRSTNKSLESLPEFFKPSPQSEDEPELSVDSILKARSYTIQIRIGKETKTYSYNLTVDDVPKQQTKQEALSQRFMKNNDHFRRSIRRLSRNDYFFPTTGLFNITCKKVPSDETRTDEDFHESSDFLLSASRFSGRAKRDLNSTDAGTESYVCYFGTPENETNVDLIPSFKKIFQSSLTQLAGIEDEFSLGNRFKTVSLNWPNSKVPKSQRTSDFMNVTCKDPHAKAEEDVTAFVHLHNPENNLEILETIELEKCQPRCLLTAARKDVCSNLKKEIVYDPQLTFWIYLVIRVFIGIIGGTAFAMFEGAVIAVLREHKADYGLQRIYASIGGMISSPLSGMLIDYASQGKGYIDFRPAFYLYAALKIVSGVLMLTINLEFKTGAKNVVTDVLNVLKNVEIIALLVSCFVLGTAWGYIESFLFWFLQDLGGSRSLMGITITVGGAAGIPLLVMSGPIIEKIGHANVLFIGFVFYAIRLLGYSLIYDPWHCLIFEAMESITSSLSFTAAVTYAAKLSSITTDSSIQGLLGGLYFGVGKGAGSLVGGYLMKAFGTRPTFQIFAVFSLLTGIMYGLFNQFYIRKRPQREGNDICKKEPKPVVDNAEMDLKIITEKPKEANQTNGTVKNQENEKVPELNKIATKLPKGTDNLGYVKDEESKNKNTKET